MNPIALYNNYRAQGEFDQELLAELLADDLPGLEAFGFDEVEIAQMFPDDHRFGSLFPDLEPEQSTMPGAKGALDEIEEMKDAQRDARKADVRAHKRSVPPGEAVQDEQPADDLAGYERLGERGEGSYDPTTSATRRTWPSGAMRTRTSSRTRRRLTSTSWSCAATMRIADRYSRPWASWT